MSTHDDRLSTDLLIVGGGPAGFAAAIRAAQHARERDRALSIMVVDKAAEPGAHQMSGAVMDPVALDLLLPDWRKDAGTRAGIPVRAERFSLLGHRGGFDVPLALLPDCFRQTGGQLVRLGHLTAWLSERAAALGVDVLPGVAAQSLQWSRTPAGTRVTGIETGAFGRLRNGEPGPRYTPGFSIDAGYTLLGEGCRGHLGRDVIARFDLDRECSPATYSLGIKELWRVDPARHRPGFAWHTAGWPLERNERGGGFVYHLDDGLVAVGLVMGLNYRNPYRDPFALMQHFKTHPAIRPVLNGAERIGFGARTLATGGYHAIVNLVFDGGALIGEDAGLFDTGRLKGIHAAILSGMMAGEAAAEALIEGRRHDRLLRYPSTFAGSALRQALWRTRNVKPLLDKGLIAGTLLVGVDQLLLRGRAPWSLHARTPDHLQLDPAADFQAQSPLKADGRITFTRDASLMLAGVHHDEDQPCHLSLTRPDDAITLNWTVFGAPEQYYCPAGVYEIEHTGERPRLRINAANCLHCKACDIKDPGQNIRWVPPQGGEGPMYNGM